MKNTRVLIRAKGRGLCIERGLYDCLQRELFADVSLNCEGGRIRANKGVLAAASPVLANLLKDWPVTEDACVIMAGYTEEEVQGLVQYIYTGQLSTQKNGSEGSAWEKIIEDFKVGLPPDSTEGRNHNNIHQKTSPAGETESNGTQSAGQTAQVKPIIMKRVGPKIVSVSSPRPLIVQVQSLTQNPSQSATAEPDSADDEENGEIPKEMSIDDGTEEVAEGEPSSASYPQVGIKRKRAVKAVAVVSSKKLRRKVALEAKAEPIALGSGLKKLSVKRGKPLSKFSRKKYCCPHCNRRFLTRGNVKNHMRIHARDKPFQCALCQETFTYQGVYQRHLLQHQENNEITSEELAPILEESLRTAEALSKHGQNVIRIMDAEQDELEAAEELEDAEEDDDDDVDDDVEDHKPLENLAKAKVDEESPGSSQGDVGVHFLCTEGKKDELVLSDDDPEEEIEGDGQGGSGQADAGAGAAAAPVVRKKPGPKSKTGEKDSKDKPKHRMNYQIIECDYCPMKYHKWSAFYVHRCTHTGETPVLPCGVCDMEFPNIKALKEHKTTAHPSAVFQCDQCERSFLSRSALLMHQPVHSTKLNFQCRYCQAKMRTLKERYVHERVHTADETPYQCSQCDKQFNTLVNLRSHLKLHANEHDPNAA